MGLLRMCPRVLAVEQPRLLIASRPRLVAEPVGCWSGGPLGRDGARGRWPERGRGRVRGFANLRSLNSRARSGRSRYFSSRQPGHSWWVGA
eukprot:5620170-Pyramimonas_sp.AAC.1